LKVGRIQLGAVDAVGAFILTAIVGVGAMLIVRGPLRESHGLAAARQDCARIQRELIEIQTSRQLIAQQMESTANRLNDQGGGLPGIRQLERHMSHVTSLASAGGVTIDSLTPSPQLDRDDHTDVYVSFTGRGPFLSFLQLLRGIEQQLDFVDVTHFGIVKDESSRSGCRLEWSLRMRVKRPAAPEPMKVSHVVKP